MILSNNECTKISGSTVEILSEFTCIISHIREMLADQFGQEFADKTITFCGELAFMSDEEREEKMDDIAEKAETIGTVKK